MDGVLIDKQTLMLLAFVLIAFFRWVFERIIASRSKGSPDRQAGESELDEDFWTELEQEMAKNNQPESQKNQPQKYAPPARDDFPSETARRQAQAPVVHGDNWLEKQRKQQSATAAQLKQAKKESEVARAKLAKMGGGDIVMLHNDEIGKDAYEISGKKVRQNIREEIISTDRASLRRAVIWHEVLKKPVGF